MFVIIGFLLLLVSLAWSVVVFGISLVSGAWWSVVPLLGSLLGLILMLRTFVFAGKNAKELKVLINVLHNVLYTLQKAHYQNEVQLKELLRTLSLDPEEFKVRF